MGKGVAENKTNSTTASRAILAKVDPAQMERILQMMLMGATDAEVRHEIRATWPGVDERPLVAAVIDNLAESGSLDQNQVAAVRGWCFEATRYLYREFVSARDFGGALRAVKYLREMADDQA